MNPEPVKCPSCGSTQIHGGNKTESSGTTFGIGQVHEGGFVTGMQSSPRTTTSFVNNCMACGYQWSPAELAERKREEQKRKQAKLREARERKIRKNKQESLKPWALSVLLQVDPLLPKDNKQRLEFKNKFVEWLIVQYARKPDETRKIDTNSRSDNHPWVVFLMEHDASGQPDTEYIKLAVLAAANQHSERRWPAVRSAWIVFGLGVLLIALWSTQWNAVDPFAAFVCGGGCLSLFWGVVVWIGLHFWAGDPADEEEEKAAEAYAKQQRRAMLVSQLESAIPATAPPVLHRRP